jgi:hypothetical protein
MSEDQAKHEARDRAHDAGVESASKLSTRDANEAVQKVQHGENPQPAKQEARDS